MVLKGNQLQPARANCTVPKLSLLAQRIDRNFRLGFPYRHYLSSGKLLPVDREPPQLTGPIVVYYRRRTAYRPQWEVDNGGSP
jgi:hypothetical protein